MSSDQINVKCEFFRNKMCIDNTCAASGRNNLPKSNCSLDVDTKLYYYAYNCPKNLFSHVSKDGNKFMALVDDDESPYNAEKYKVNPNILFAVKKMEFIGKKKVKAGVRHK